MKAIVLYDSTYGNTKKIAEAIVQELDAKAVSISSFDLKELEGIELLIIGSPIHGWRPSEKMGGFLSKLSSGQLKGVKAAAFDTRVKLFIHGDAAGKISKALRTAGAQIISSPQAFLVKSTEGPLFESELEKAASWAKSLKNSI